MELFGIGPLELFFILIIALIVLGPRDMVKAGNTLGRFMRKTILSPTWMKIQREIRSLPYQMMREAGLEEQDLRIDTGLNSVLNADPNKITSMLVQNQVQQPAPPVENTIGNPLDIPNEWLGQAGTEQKRPNGAPSADLSPSIADWTSTPEVGERNAAPEDDPQEAKDSI